MSADDDIQTVIVPDAAQNALFADGQIDALCAHTPFLETALVSQDAVLLVNQSAGEVEALAGRQIHSDRGAALAAIRSSGVRLQAPDALELLAEIYSPAVPATPAVSVEGALRELDLFPGRRTPPDLDAAALAGFIDTDFASRAVALD